MTKFKSISKQEVIHTLEVTNYNITRTGIMMGISLPTLYKLMDMYGIRGAILKQRESKRNYVPTFSTTLSQEEIAKKYNIKTTNRYVHNL
jgi:hypothetical protein